VAEFTNFATLLAFIGVNASAVKIFSRDHAESRIKHITRDIVLPLVGCIASAWLAIGLGWRAALFGMSLLIIGIIVYFLLKRFSPDTGH
jgi:amino acid transporter